MSAYGPWRGAREVDANAWALCIPARAAPSFCIFAEERQTAPHARAFRVDGRTLAGGDAFALIDDGVPDGIRVDDEGRLWSSAFDGVHCFDHAGELIGKVKVPEIVSNLCFGGPRRNRLYMTGTTSLHAVTLCVNGAQRP